MTIDQFDNTGFRNGDAVEYQGKRYDVVSVDFEEKLFGIEFFPPEKGDDGIRWKRCENCTFIPHP